MNLLRKLSTGPKWRLLTLVGVILLCGFLIASTISYVISRHSIRSAILENELPLSSNNIYSEIQHDLFRPILISSLMANDTFVKDWLERGEGDEPAIFDYLYHIREKYGAITAFLVSERTRKYYNATDVLKRVSEDNPLDTWFFRVRNMTDDYEINVDPDMSNDNAMTIFINYRVVRGNGEFLAATGVGLSVSAVKSLMREYRTHFHRDVYFYDRNAKLVLHSQGDGAGETGLASHGNDEAMLSLIKRVGQGETNVTASAVGSNGALVNYRYIPELNWILVVEQLSDGTRPLLYQTLFLNILVCLLVTVALLAIFRNTIVRYHESLESKNAQLEIQAEQLRNANAARDRLFSIIGHDLRGPVATIKQSLELLDDESIDAHDFKEIRADLRSGVDHVLIALGNLMEWGNLQAGPLQAKPEPLNLRGIAEEEIQLLALLAKEKAIQIENRIPDRAWVRSDPRQMKSVLRNLLSNAIKFTPSNGLIVASAEKEEERWALCINDNGIGMDAQKVGALLAGDRNITSTPGTNGERGLGLGAQLCLDFVRANNGTLSVQSSPGHGTSIRVLLPISEELT